MFRTLPLVVCALLLAACTSAPRAAAPTPTAAPKPAATVAPEPTAAPKPTAVPPPTVAPKPTAVPKPTVVPTTAAAKGPDYVAMRGKLLTPLGGLIVSVRTKSETRARHLADFNTAAVPILDAIKADMSVNANRLNSVIVNTRDAAARGDLATLERQRDELLLVR